jgi:hypothetical protein
VGIHAAIRTRSPDVLGPRLRGNDVSHR